MYSYHNLLDDVNYLAHFGIDTGSIGSSVGGNLIPYIHIGSGEGAQIIVTGAIHAREHVSALLIIKQVYALINSGKAEKGVLDGGIYFVPMVNPDGNLLCFDGADVFPLHKERLLQVNGSADFSLFKANLNCVDLNCNFDARFGEGAGNLFSPAPSSYVGKRAFSEPETRALAQFTEMVRPKTTVSYHALGQEIYWQFYQEGERLKRDRQLALYVNGFLNYTLIDSTLGSAGGYKDWCVDKLKIPSLTIEVVANSYSHPLSDNSVKEDVELNKFLPEKIIEYATKFL